MLAIIGQVVLLMVAVLAGFGVAALQRGLDACALAVAGGCACCSCRQRRGATGADRLHMVRRRAGRL